MFHDNDSQLVVNIAYQLLKKELASMKLRHCLYDVSLLNVK